VIWTWSVVMELHRAGNAPPTTAKSARLEENEEMLIAEMGSGFAIVRISVAVWPVVTSPNCKLPGP
jgi:hypothetical protein